MCRPRALSTPLVLRGRPMAERMRVTRKKALAVGVDIAALWLFFGPVCGLGGLGGFLSGVRICCCLFF